MSSTYTYAVLEVDPATYQDIAKRLIASGAFDLVPADGEPMELPQIAIIPESD